MVSWCEFSICRCGIDYHLQSQRNVLIRNRGTMRQLQVILVQSLIAPITPPRKILPQVLEVPANKEYPRLLGPCNSEFQLWSISVSCRCRTLLKFGSLVWIELVGTMRLRPWSFSPACTNAEHLISQNGRWKPWQDSKNRICLYVRMLEVPRLKGYFIVLLNIYVWRARHVT